MTVRAMDPRLNIITLGVKDLQRSVRFYRDGLGWQPAKVSNEHIVFIPLGGVLLALYGREALAEDAKLPDAAAGGFAGFTLAQNVASKDAVRAALARAQEAGGQILKPAQDVFWGGYSGYFADPDGFAWAVAWNPHFTLTDSGQVILPE